MQILKQHWQLFCGSPTAGLTTVALWVGAIMIFLAEVAKI